jgi:branched-chain amino acid transport system ATP-binding protein
MLLDEPTSGVSTRDKVGMMDMLVTASREVGLQAILLVEHDMDIVFGYADRIVVLQEGGILADTTPARLQADPTLLAAVAGRVGVSARQP